MLDYHFIDNKTFKTFLSFIQYLLLLLCEFEIQAVVGFLLYASFFPLSCLLLKMSSNIMIHNEVRGVGNPSFVRFMNTKMISVSYLIGFEMKSLLCKVIKGYFSILTKFLFLISFIWQNQVIRGNIGLKCNFRCLKPDYTVISILLEKESNKTFKKATVWIMYCLSVVFYDTRLYNNFSVLLYDMKGGKKMDNFSIAGSQRWHQMVHGKLSIVAIKLMTI